MCQSHNHTQTFSDIFTVLGAVFALLEKASILVNTEIAGTEYASTVDRPGKCEYGICEYG